MNPDTSTTRRNLLKTGAAASAVAAAGCQTAVPQDRVTVSEVDTQPRAATDQGSLDAAKETDTDRVAADPTDIPDPIDRDESTTIELEMTTKEVTAEIEAGVTFDYMTFDGQIPGPMVRARVGDTIDLTLKNDESNAMSHNVDFHACYGPGRGAETTNVAPGEEARLRFQVRYPGFHIYRRSRPSASGLDPEAKLREDRSLGA